MPQEIALALFLPGAAIVVFATAFCLAWYSRREEQRQIEPYAKQRTIEPLSLRWLWRRRD